MRFNSEAYEKLFPRQPEEPKNEMAEDSMIVEESVEQEEAEQDSVVAVKEQEVDEDGDSGVSKPNSE